MPGRDLAPLIGRDTEWRVLEEFLARGRDGADDLQWVDPASIAFLEFVARRIDGSGIGLLTAVRSEAVTVAAAVGLPLLDITTLRDDDAVRLVEQRYPILAGRVGSGGGCWPRPPGVRSHWSSWPFGSFSRPPRR